MQVKTRTQLIAGMAAAIQARASGLLDLTIGSILRAVVESVADVSSWLTGLGLAVAALTRAATSTGADLDTFMADYGLTRLPADPSVGALTFSRFSTGLQAVVPVGALAQSADGSLQFQVTLDTTNAAYSATAGGYVAPVGTASVSVPATCLTAGAAGNVVAGAVSVIVQALPGVDTVTNPLPFASGADAESDAALRVRFPAYLGSLGKATPTAIGFALSELGPTVSYAIEENVNYDGSANPGHLTIIVDDGTGSPPTAFLASAGLAVEAYRAAGITYEVHGPTDLIANVALTVSVAPGYAASAVQAAVTTALGAFIASLTLGKPLRFSRLTQVAYDASPGVANVSAVSLNGGSADIIATGIQVIRAGALTITTA